jgi:uncharacterized protein (UPF0297 family)
MQSENEGHGSHWVACNKIGNNIEYFDSFGCIYPEDLQKTFSHCYITWNKKQIQNINSSACGYFCIGLGCYITRNKKSEYFIANFSTNTSINDMILFNILKQEKIL